MLLQGRYLWVRLILYLRAIMWVSIVVTGHTILIEHTLQLWDAILALRMTLSLQFAFLFRLLKLVIYFVENFRQERVWNSIKILIFERFTNKRGHFRYEIIFQLMDNFLLVLALLLHNSHFLLIVVLIIISGRLFFFDSSIVFLEKSLSLIMDKIAKDFKTVPLLDSLLLKKFGNSCDSMPELLQLLLSLLILGLSLN